MKMCDRCGVPGCCLTYLGKACQNARREHCPDVQLNNAERITNMDRDELADFLMDVSMGLLFDKKIMNVKKWLDEPCEEGQE